ncbi:hypothetical protein Q1695_012695 [Nippostrongylus brasiliensis]|nr:hypothetical protein Q1695_012695 [Nippostrongylus brasiliensis]
MLFVLLLLPLLFPALHATPNCSYKGKTLEASWKFVGIETNVPKVRIELNATLGDDKWTGIAFGEAMTKLEVVTVSIIAQNAWVRTGYADSYGPPVLDPFPNVQMTRMSYEDNKLYARIERPLGAVRPRRHSLEGCQMWDFIDVGDVIEGEIFEHADVPKQIEVCIEMCD